MDQLAKNMILMKRYSYPEDITGTAAVAKVDLQWPRVHYVDYLSLIKIGDEWKIVNKIWHQGPPVEPRAG